MRIDREDLATRKYLRAICPCGRRHYLIPWWERVLIAAPLGLAAILGVDSLMSLVFGQWTYEPGMLILIPKASHPPPDAVRAFELALAFAFVSLGMFGIELLLHRHGWLRFARRVPAAFAERRRRPM